jgi:eukaryotic-like serine/threonine-protein kinase
MQEGTLKNRDDGRSPVGGDPPLAAGQVQSQLEKILASPLFCKAPRHSRFLTFVVHKTLAGEADAVKEYVIGLEVFDRSPGYDPGTDPIVRAEARRLRSRLADYYREFGQQDPVHIDLPKGTYVPTFHGNGVTARPAIGEGASPSKTQEHDEKVCIVPAIEPIPPATAQRKRHLAWLALLAILILALAGDSIYKFYARKTLVSPASEGAANNVLVLAEFTNTSGDAVFDHTLRQGLSSQLEQSPFLNLLSDQRIAQTLSLMAQPKDIRLTRELAREVCLRTGSAASIEGSVSSQGNQYVLALQAVNCRNGDILSDQHVTADDKQQVLNALGIAAAKLRQNLGESLASVKRYDAAAENVTTASLEALQAYSLGSHAMMVMGDYEAAIPHFQQAISLDPNFAMAYARLGTSFENLDQTAQAADSLRKAYALRQRVSDRERFYIDSHYDQLVTGDLVAARATYELWAQTYPSDEVPAINLGRTYAELGDYDKSLAAYQKALKLNPGSGLLYGNLVYSYLSVDRLDEAKATAREAQARHLDSDWIHFYLYWVDFVQHDTAGMQREIAGEMGKPGSEDLAFYVEADTAAYAGRMAKAQELTRRAAESAQHSDQKDTAAGYEAIDAVHEALAGEPGTAKQEALSAIAVSSSKEVEAMSGLALALTGDSVEAMRLAADLAKRYPENTLVRFNDVPTIRAALALHHGNPDKAIDELAPAAPYELGRGDFIWLYPVYLRGIAYLAAHQTTAAAAEFQTILSRPGVVLNEPIGALAYLGLGRAYALAGDTAKAKTAYQDFLALWKDADPNLPILKQAQAEYAKLP